MLAKGLVLLISIGFAAGVIRLSKKQVLVHKLHSIENLAHCDTVCLDKSGTLTEGILSVEKVFADIGKKEFEKLMRTYISCANDNNSTYTALKNHFKGGEVYGCISGIPFSSERKYSAVMLENGQTFVISAPEKLCKTVPQKAADLYIDMSTAAAKNIESIAEKYTVFGRVTPKQKKLLISAMQKKGHKVAMTGGVNDLLALRQADCSAAMGAGCDAAKQTAQLVLLNSDF